MAMTNQRRLRNEDSPNSKATTTRRVYIRGHSLYLAVLQVGLMLFLDKLLLTSPGMVSQFVVYPIDTLKLYVLVLCTHPLS